jgi:hypothetical protein
VTPVTLYFCGDLAVDGKWPSLQTTELASIVATVDADKIRIISNDIVETDTLRIVRIEREIEAIYRRIMDIDIVMVGNNCRSYEILRI